MEARNVLGWDDAQIFEFNTELDDLGSARQYMFLIAIDGSRSMKKYEPAMNVALKRFQAKISRKSNKHEILIARADFSSTVRIGGFKTIDEFNTDYSADGQTWLHDCIIEGQKHLTTFVDAYARKGVTVTAYVIFFSDGEHYGSSTPARSAAESLAILNAREDVAATAFVAFGNDAQGIAEKLGFTDIKDCDASEDELGKIFDDISSSVSARSSNVGAKQSSQTGKFFVAPTDDFTV